MNRRSFLKLLGVAPLVPLAKKLPVPEKPKFSIHVDADGGIWKIPYVRYPVGRPPARYGQMRLAAAAQEC